MPLSSYYYRLFRLELQNIDFPSLCRSSNGGGIRETLGIFGKEQLLRKVTGPDVSNHEVGHDIRTFPTRIHKSFRMDPHYQPCILHSPRGRIPQYLYNSKTAKQTA